MNKLLLLDCDSTLCAIEGVDELAALRGSTVEQQVIDLTNQAMDGTVPIDQVFGRRLDLIQPSREMCDEVAQMYIEKLSPNAEKVISKLKETGWKTMIISGGFSQVIRPVANQLGIEDVFAVDLIFDKDGKYQDFDNESPTAKNGGKPEVIKALKKDISPLTTVMMGDGISDLETNTVVDLFVGYGGVVSRKAVQAQATSFITDFNELPATIAKYLSESI